MRVHEDKTAWRAVDACGGAFPTPRNDYDSGWRAGHDAALDAALEAVKPADALTAELFKVVFNLVDHHEGVPMDALFKELPNHVAWAIVSGRGVIAKATGEQPA
jgi:hypothetical protein